MKRDKMIQKMIEYSGKAKNILEKSKEDLLVTAYFFRKGNEIKSIDFEYGDTNEKEKLKTKLQKIVKNKKPSLVLIVAEGDIFTQEKMEVKKNSIIVVGATPKAYITISVPFDRIDDEIEVFRPMVINNIFTYFIEDLWKPNYKPKKGED